jgi:hypothetical protein
MMIRETCWLTRNYRFPGRTRPLLSMLDSYMAAPEWWREIFDLIAIR